MSNENLTIDEDCNANTVFPTKRSPKISVKGSTISINYEDISFSNCIDSTRTSSSRFETSSVLDSIPSIIMLVFSEATSISTTIDSSTESVSILLTL